MEYQKKEIRIFQNGRTVNDQFYIDGDYNVPEAKRDVGKIILSNGMLRVEEMKQVESYLKVSGKLEFKFSIWQMRWFRYRQAWKGGSHLKR